MDLKLPPLGEGVDSGSVVGILVREGDTVAKGQGIIELETGKAVAPVPSPAAGKVTKILVSVGDKISVGQPILSIEGGAAAPAKAGGAPTTAVPASTTSENFFASSTTASSETSNRTMLTSNVRPEACAPSSGALAVPLMK